MGGGAPPTSSNPSTIQTNRLDDVVSSPAFEITPPVPSGCFDRRTFAEIADHKTKRMRKKATASGNSVESSQASSCSSSLWGTSPVASQRGLRVSVGRRNPKVLIGSVRQKEGDVEALALPLGMAIAAVVAQVLEKREAAGQKLSAEHLSTICSLAVRESLANVFGKKFDCFIRNFEKSFRSTLMTLSAISDCSQINGEANIAYLNEETCQLYHRSTLTLNSRDSPHHSEGSDGQSEAVSGAIEDRGSQSSFQEADSSMEKNLRSYEVNLCDGQVGSQLALVPPSRQHPAISQSMLTTMEKSVTEQARSNDLKTLEISLTMKKLRMKESQLALNSDSNFLERLKLETGLSKASFKAEKFKNELKDARHAELLKKCIDCLLAGVLIMLACIGYGTYVYSHRRITEATASCAPAEGSNSWWIPKTVASFNTGFQNIWCYVQVMSRMLFGVLMILAVSYLLLQRSAMSQQTMPITFLLLLLGGFCGFTGKLCMDTLGADGFQWLVFWEALCLLHFFANGFTSILFFILHGPITISEKPRGRMIFPYWLRQGLFYTTTLLFLPLMSGLTPFASPAEWRKHFWSLVRNVMQIDFE